MVEYFGLVRAAICEGQAQGIFRPGLRDKIAANCFFGAVDEMVTSWVLDGTHYQLSDVADSVADIILLGLEK
jgi:TetR/AcrR family transcriptional regulator, fatty acid metabolism regulator protein